MSYTSELKLMHPNDVSMFNSLIGILDKIDKALDEEGMFTLNTVYEIRDIAQKAISNPRNADIGDVNERRERFRLFCSHFKHCEDCPVGNEHCFSGWEDMPYKSNYQYRLEEKPF